MIGIEYICKLFNKQYKDLAEELGVSKQMITFWISRKRKISDKHLLKLEDIFKISKKYFYKELTNLDKLKIKYEKLMNVDWIEEEYKETFIDENGKEQTRVCTYRDDVQIAYAEDLKCEIKLEELKVRIDKTINNVSCDTENINFYTSTSILYEKEKRMNLYVLLTDVIENGNITVNTVTDILKGIKKYQMKTKKMKTENKTESNLVKNIENIVETEEKRLNESYREFVEEAKKFTEL